MASLRELFFPKIQLPSQRAIDEMLREIPDLYDKCVRWTDRKKEGLQKWSKKTPNTYGEIIGRYASLRSPVEQSDIKTAFIGVDKGKTLGAAPIVFIHTARLDEKIEEYLLIRDGGLFVIEGNDFSPIRETEQLSEKFGIVSRIVKELI
jgi:hypothetical protein